MALIFKLSNYRLRIVLKLFYLLTKASLLLWNCSVFISIDLWHNNTAIKTPKAIESKCSGLREALKAFMHDMKTCLWNCEAKNQDCKLRNQKILGFCIWEKQKKWCVCKFYIRHGFASFVLNCIIKLKSKLWLIFMLTSHIGAQLLS